jgi:transcriptional regulator with XRE-family HTH domain
LADNAYKKLREMLLAARRAANLTQVELSARLKRPQSFVSKYERGERSLDVVEFGEVARALGIDPMRILGKLYREIS